jgi:hypothetical protein
LPLLITELETRDDQLKASETDMKNLSYREQEARKVLVSVRNMVPTLTSR